MSNLTPGQELMWLGQQLHPDTPLYNMIFTFTIKGPVDAATFGKAFNALIAASDNLRTVIRDVDGTPMRVVLNTLNYNVELVDLSNEIKPDVALQTWLDHKRTTVFDLSTRLFESVLLKLADDRFVWYFNQHHLIMDVGSSVLTYTHLSSLYEQVVAGETLTLPEIPPYQNYVDHIAQVRNTHAYTKAKAFWQQQLEQPVKRINLYKTQDDNLSARTERVRVELGAARMAQLEALAGTPGIRSLSRELTFSNLFGALILAFLHRMTHNDTLRLGLPLANRSTPAFKETLGMFIEVLFMHVDFDENDTFATLVKKVAASNMQTLQNAHPGIGTAAHNRAYDVLMNFIVGSLPDFAGMPTTTEWIHSGYGDSNHKLRIQIHDWDATGTYALDFDFNTAIFNEQERELAVKHFLAVVDACLDNIEQPLHEITLLSDDEYQRNVIAFNDTAANYPANKTVIDMFEAEVERSPNAIALRLRDETMTYAELNTRVNALAGQLIAAGVQADTLVPLCAEHSFEMMVGILAILKAGSAYVPLDPTHPDERVKLVLEGAGSMPFVLTQPHLAARFAEMGYPTRDITSTADETPNPTLRTAPENLAYVIFTSGTTGKPKGVQVEHSSLTNYLTWAQKHYTNDDAPITFALYSSLAFDLTVTSVFLPLISGGTVHLYPEAGQGGAVIRQVFEENAVDVVKLTPSHLALVRDMDLSQTRIKTLIVGGENFKTELAQTIHRISNGRIAQFNEYGPTEATVACMIHRYQPQSDVRGSVPIGTPADNMRVYVLDERLQPTPTGVIGEMYVSGVNVARGYLNRPDLTAARFMDDPFGSRMYKTGDLARWLPTGQLEFLGRGDEQVKVGGVRIELGEVEAALGAYPAITAAAADVRVIQSAAQQQEENLTYCTRCGLASNYPGITFDDDDVCSICTSFEAYKDKAQQYFKTTDELTRIVEEIKAKRTGDYDVVALLSGGKDSTYMLYQLVNMGLKVLTFTLDNGYISDEAKANIRRITDNLGVDHVFGETPFMNDIFADSLRRYANVCNGCFKTIYTMAVNLAREKGISTVMTGLSRGQFFETRLTEELFTGDDFDVNAIDESIARARRAYHQRDDIISRSLDVDVFRNGDVFEDVQFVDFYRYTDVSLEEMYEFLENHALWVRPSDTGRSTNCLINEVGIYVHKKRRGFHNYSLPYSWDVRIGHKTRDEAVEELNDEIDLNNVKRILREIGYTDPLADEQEGQQRLVAYYVSDGKLTAAELREFMATKLPQNMIPTHYVSIDEMPLAPSGKVNRKALPDVYSDTSDVISTQYTAPTNELEKTLVEIWQDVLHLERVGINDNFFDIGGHSLPAIRTVTRIKSLFEMDFPLETFFANPTIAQLATAIEDQMLSDLDTLTDAELEALLQEN